MFSNILNYFGLTEIIIAVLALLTAYVVLELRGSKKRNFPSGPKGLPVVGYLPFLTNNPHKQFYELSKKYGAVFSLKLGMKEVFVLNDAKSIREAFSKPELLGRPELSVFSIIDMITPFFENGKLWHQQRRFAVQTLKELGLGKSVMHDRVTEEIQHLLEVIRKAKGQCLPVKEILSPSMSNNICSLVFGRRYEYDDPSRKLLDQALEDTSRLLGQTSYQLFFPWINSIPILNWILKTNEFERKFATLSEFIIKEIEAHKSNLDANSPNDYIDRFLIEMEARSAEADSTFNEKVLLGCVNNLFGAGSETVRTTVSWCLYFMAAYPDIQAKVQKEISDVIGSERFPAFTDQKNMPCTQSVLLEIQRYVTVFPINLLRCVLEDTTICGYDAPKGTYVIANFWATHHDPNCWENPQEFIPDRFLDKDKKSVIKPEAYMPFSYGKRNCPGEGLAVMEIFLYFVAILQKFNLRFPSGQTTNFEAELSITYHLKPYKICFLPRQ